MADPNYLPGASVIPPPLSAMFPPPLPSDQTRSSSSPSSASSRKRKRSDHGARSIATSAASSTSDFSRGVKEKVIRLDDGTTCWHCGASPTDICHVVGRRDRAFPELLQQGLITFDSLGHVDNAIPLCPLCHRNFDDINQPGFLFIPSDLQYFIDYERADFDRRTTAARNTDSTPPRLCPNPKMYFEHQMRTGDVEPDHCGGKYVRYTLRDYFPKLGHNDWIPGRGPFKDAEAWHGAPTAALRRAFQVLGDPLVRGIDGADRRKLRELQDLYMREVGVESVNIVETHPPSAGQGDNGGGATPENVGRSCTDRGAPSSGHQTGTGEHQGHSLGEEPQNRRRAENPPLSPSSILRSDKQQLKKRIPPILFDRLLRKRPRPLLSPKLWKWGPHSSSQEKAAWFSLLNHG